ncbi:unnamed protein product [Rotaria sordida]|uniref:Uncharacterized protein n=1 Tax=Rotaria sordida TaxID=392033 RepID=A0A813YYE6_9BILA|nr:unnamed protein product [Rotaria sordida]CAF3734153.1 unnamed protein product [Rotaria sordida]
MVYFITTLFIIIVIFYDNIANAIDLNYPTITQAGFHHNALLYIDGIHSPEKLMLWLTGSYESLDSHKVIFDTITILAEKTPTNSFTAYSTNQQDWIWFLEIKLFGSNGILSNLTQALNQLNIKNQKLQIIIMLPYIDPIGQENFSSTLNLSIQNHRQQVIQWYIDTIKEQIKQYSMLHLWGIYLMREDIIFGINEQITLEISHIVHTKQLRLLWIPYTSAINWNNWTKLGIDVAILQPGYAFSSPLMQGTFNAGRLRATAKLAQKYGLRVEIETNQGGSTEYEIALLQNYLAQGSIDGYQYVPTAYFLGNYNSIARSKKACDLLRNYTSGLRIESTFISNTKWFWTINENLQATINISSNIIPQGIRINWSLKHKYWFGRIIVEGFIIMDNNYTWKLLSSTEIGEKNWRDDDWTSTLLPFSLLLSQKILSLRVLFLNSIFLPSLTDEDLIIEQIPNGIALQISAGAPYHISPSMFSYNPQYGDPISETFSNFSRGLLTDRQWSIDEWQSTMSIGWLDNSYSHSYIRIALDFGNIIHVDQILVRSHGGSYAGVNWPNTARLLISTDCIPFSPYSSSDCTVKSYPCTDRIITGGIDMNQGGILSFTFSNSLRWATLEFQPNAWLMIDEIQAFVNGREISNLINYYFLTPPTSQTISSSMNNYLDDGVRLTDGVIAGMMGSITGWLKSEPHTITIDLLINRNIRETSVWTLIKADWAISPPRLVVVSTSLDSITWILFGEQGQMQIGERMLDAQRLYITNDNTSLARYIKFDFVSDELFPEWWTMVSEVTATD